MKVLCEFQLSDHLPIASSFQTEKLVPHLIHCTRVSQFVRDWSKINSELFMLSSDFILDVFPSTIYINYSTFLILKYSYVWMLILRKFVMRFVLLKIKQFLFVEFVRVLFPVVLQILNLFHLATVQNFGFRYGKTVVVRKLVS